MINVLWLLLVYCGCGLLLRVKKHNTITDDCWQIVIGESFFFGVFILILAGNIIQWLNTVIDVRFMTYGFSVLAVVSLAVVIYGNKHQVHKKLMTIKSWRPKGYHVLAGLLLVIHFYQIIQQNQSLPLTPWDAWNSWIAKAKIWYYHGLNEVLVNRPDWLLTVGHFTNPTAHYPDGLPMLYVINSGFFEWHETALNAIYPAMFVAFSLAFYGHVKQLTNDTYALIALVLIASVPFVNVHFALSGYADIWMAALLVLVIFNAQQFLSQPHVWSLIKLLIFLITLVMFKLESWIWVSIFVLVFSLCLINANKRKWLYLLIFVTTLIWYFLGGLHVQLPFGELVISPSLIKVPGLGTYVLAFVDTTSAWLEALFFSKNWHVLWYSIPLVLYCYFKTEDTGSVLLPTLYLLFSVFFMYVLFYMTYASVFASDFTSSNRIVLHIVPLYVYFLIHVIYRYHQQCLQKRPHQ